MMLDEAWTMIDLMLQASIRSSWGGRGGLRLTTEVCFVMGSTCGDVWPGADDEERETGGAMLVTRYLYRRFGGMLYPVKGASCTIGRCFSSSCPPSCKTWADLVAIEPTRCVGSGGSSSFWAGASRTAGAAIPSVLVWLETGMSLLLQTGSRRRGSLSTTCRPLAAHPYVTHGLHLQLSKDVSLEEGCESCAGGKSLDVVEAFYGHVP